MSLRCHLKHFDQPPSESDLSRSCWQHLPCHGHSPGLLKHYMLGSTRTSVRKSQLRTNGGMRKMCPICPSPPGASGTRRIPLRWTKMLLCSGRKRRNPRGRVRARADRFPWRRGRARADREGALAHQRLVQGVVVPVANQKGLLGTGPGGNSKMRAVSFNKKTVFGQTGKPPCQWKSVSLLVVRRKSFP